MTEGTGPAGGLRTALKLRRIRTMRALAAKLSEWSQACLRLAEGPAGPTPHRFSGAKTKPAWETMLRHLGRRDVVERLFSGGLIGDDLPRVPGLPPGRRILVLAAHQDDETLGAGGTFLLCARDGRAFETIYYTDGATRVADLPPEQVSALRRDEARRVWKRLAGIEPVFWNYPNRAPQLAPDAGQRLADAIARFQPDTIFLPLFLEQPMEHRRLNEVLLAADALSPLGAEIEVWGYQITTRLPGNRAVDITPVWKDKYALNELWRTQNAYTDYPHLAMGRDIANSYYLKGSRLPRRARSHAELFLAFPAPEYLDFARTFSDVAAGAPEQVTS